MALSPLKALVFGAVSTATLVCATAPSRATDASDSFAGIWTVALDGSPRQCRVQLRTDSSGTGHALSMPPGCHRALPVLQTVTSWSAPGDGHLDFEDGAGQAILVFDEAGTGSMHAAGPEGSGYTLTALNADRARMMQKTEPASSSDARLPANPATLKTTTFSAASVAGHYAVMRGDRDTGCMVTLDSSVPGPKNSLKARLAPACRDQGIVIFDPVGWTLHSGKLVLTARKGHTADLSQNEAGLWVKEPPNGAPLALKRL